MSAIYEAYFIRCLTSICMAYVMHILFAHSLFFSLFLSFVDVVFFPLLNDSLPLLLFTFNTNVCAHWLHVTLILSLPFILFSLPSLLSILWRLFVSSFHTFVPVLSLSSLWPLLFLIHLSFLAFVPTYFRPYLFSSPPPSILSHLPSLPTIGKWGVARVLVWTGTPLGAAALPGPNSLAPVVMWTSSRLPWQQHHLPRSPPSTPIRKMDKPPLNAFLIGRMHSRDRLSNTDS